MTDNKKKKKHMGDDDYILTIHFMYIFEPAKRLAVAFYSKCPFPVNLFVPKKMINKWYLSCSDKQLFLHYSTNCPKSEITNFGNNFLKIFIFFRNLFLIKLKLFNNFYETVYINLYKFVNFDK